MSLYENACAWLKSDSTHDDFQYNSFALQVSVDALTVNFIGEVSLKGYGAPDWACHGVAREIMGSSLNLYSRSVSLGEAWSGHGKKLESRIKPEHHD